MNPALRQAGDPLPNDYKKLARKKLLTLSNKTDHSLKAAHSCMHHTEGCEGTEAKMCRSGEQM